VSTFLLTWAADQWNFEVGEYEERVSRSVGGRVVGGSWATGNRKRGVQPGDRAFLLRQRDNRGIVASGWFASVVYEDQHWDGSGRLANYADVEWDVWLPIGDRLPVELLMSDISAFPWSNMQASGIVIPAAASEMLELLWQSHLRASGWGTTWLPEEVTWSERYVEGSVTRIDVNRYERDPRARAASLGHWGHSCSVCNFDFSKVYGSIGDGFIVVHHLTEISTVGPDYEIDPVNDLRPVCPNCHAMLHTTRPARTIDELREILAESRWVDSDVEPHQR
jgi:5-methylcytosine-specific restriction protein A